MDVIPLGVMRVDWSATRPESSGPAWLSSMTGGYRLGMPKPDSFEYNLCFIEL